MKKNKLIGILAISAMMGLSGCNFVGIQPSCVHDWSTWDIIEEPTCIQKGSRERFCYKCGKEQTRSIAIDLVYGHSYYENPDDDRAATCTEPGIEGSQICLRCGQKKKGTKSELAGHKYEIVADPGDAKYHAATCTQDGLQQKKCKTCGDIKDEVLAKTGHGDYVVEKNGILGVVKCGKCNDKAGYELDIADAVGFNTPNTKMNATSGASSMSTWDIGSFIGSVIPEGFYDIQLEAAMTNESHANRKLYNMGRTELQVDDDETQNGNDNNADKASQAPYRYFLKVNGTEVINPLTKKSYGELGMGVGTGNFHYVEFVEGVQIDSTTTTLSLAHGNIGYSLYCRSIRLVPHNHDIEKSVVPSSADTVAHTVEKCSCGYRKVTLNALSGTFANGVVNANDAPEGYLKLASSTDSITYKLNVSENMTGRLYMVGRQTDAYMNQSPYNMKWTYRGEEITGADTSKVTSDFLTDNGADMAGYSKEVKVLVGNITLKDNTFNSGDLVYKRTGDYNIVVSEIVFEGRPAGHIHNYQHTLIKLAMYFAFGGR